MSLCQVVYPQYKLSTNFNLMKKVILVFAVAVISVLGRVSIANASDVRPLCSLTGKITDVTNDYVYFVATGKSPQGFLLEKCLSYNISYRFTRPLRVIFLKDQKVFIELFSISAMGPNGPTPSSEKWNIKSNVDVLRPFNIYIQPEKVAELAPDIIIENRTYTIKELNTNTFHNTKKFFTEAHVTYVYKQLPCPPGTEGICEPPRSPYIIISDENTRSSYVQTNKDAVLRIDNYSGDSFKVGGKYRFEVSVRNISNTSIPENEFTLISVKDSSNQIIATSTSQVVGVQPVKKSFVARFISWILSIFGK